MAPSKPLITLGPPLKTRAANKDKHPGMPDATKPRRKPAEMEQLRQESANLRQQEENAQKEALEDIAEIEDRLQDEDNDRECQRAERHKANLNKKS
jgi:hypothetical protein